MQHIYHQEHLEELLVDHLHQFEAEVSYDP